jgi:pyruvate dehydrogenase (quinone)/pyruvate oxidase
MIDTLINWGVEVIFGLPGDGINGITESLRMRQDQIRFIQVRHEEAAAFMACGYAKYTGRLGVCLATSGPGGIHLLNGLYDAKLDGQSVLAITGNQFHDLMDTYAQQDIALDRLFEDVSVYNTRVMGFHHVQTVTDLACRHALAYKGVSHITFPKDIQEWTEESEKKSVQNIVDHTSEIFAMNRGLPDQHSLDRAAQILNEGKKIVIMAGRGAIPAREELERLAEKLGAPIVKPLLGKAAVPDDSPYTTGGIGLLGTEPSEDALEHCDTLLMVGTSFPYLEFYPKKDRVRGVQIEINPAKIGLRFPVEAGLVGDSKKSLQALLPLLNEKTDKSFLQRAQRHMKDWRNLMEKRATVMDMPMKPQVVAHELGKRLADDAIVSCDSGTITTWWARHIPARGSQMHSVSGMLATMACGLPYAIAAQIAYPNRQCVAFVGDGGFTMLMSEFITAVKYQLPIKVVVIKNNELGQIRWEQLVMLGVPEFGIELQPIDFVGVANALGALGVRIEDPKNCGELLEKALNHPGPALIEAVVDQNEPPLPAKIKPDQAKHFAEALLKNEPKRVAIASTILKDKVRELI